MKITLDENDKITLTNEVFQEIPIIGILIAICTKHEKPGIYHLKVNDDEDVYSLTLDLTILLDAVFKDLYLTYSEEVQMASEITEMELKHKTRNKN